MGQTEINSCIIKKIRKNPQIFIAEKGLKSIKKIAQAIIKAE